MTDILEMDAIKALAGGSEAGFGRLEVVVAPPLELSGFLAVVCGLVSDPSVDRAAWLENTRNMVAGAEAQLAGRDGSEGKDAIDVMVEYAVFCADKQIGLDVFMAAARSFAAGWVAHEKAAGREVDGAMAVGNVIASTVAMLCARCEVDLELLADAVIDLKREQLAEARKIAATDAKFRDALAGARESGILVPSGVH